VSHVYFLYLGTNEYVGRRGIHCKSLKTDLADGLVLINLMEVISGKKLGKYNKHPKVNMQKLENLGIVLRFIQVKIHFDTCYERAVL
jgi:hypothetical protein